MSLDEFSALRSIGATGGNDVSNGARACKLTPWQRIMDAAKSGRGIRLSYDEVARLSMDYAIETKARNDDEEQGRTAPPWAYTERKEQS